MPTYVYLGHGTDLIKRISGPREPDKWNVSSIETVPEGCTYATISETGVNVLTPLFFYLTKIAMDPIRSQLLMKPKKNYKDIKNLIAGTDSDFFNSYIYTTRNPIQSLQIISNATYHLKLPGYKYINRKCTFLLDFENNDKSVTIYRSGLYDIEKPINPPLPYNLDDIIIHTVPQTDNEGNVVLEPNGDKIQALRLGDIKKIYKDSIFPTIDNIISVIKEIEPSINLNNDNIQVQFLLLQTAVQKILREINQKELLQMFPGNHFNFSCRGYGEGDEKLTKVRIQQLRQESKRQIYKGSLLNRLKSFNPFKRKTQVAPAHRKGRKNRTRKN